MKILHFLEGRCNPDTANGVEKTIYHLAINQARLGHKVSVYGVSKKSTLPIEGVEVRHFPPSLFPWNLPGELFKALDTLRPDIVHFHSMYVPCNAALGRILRKRGIPYVVTPNGNCNRNLLRRRPWFKIPFKILVERPFLNHARYVHSVGDTEAIQDYGVTAPVIVAPNGIDQESVPQVATRNPILAARPEWLGRTIFSFVGRLDTEQKGLDLMLQGLAGATEKDRIGLVLVGPDWKGRRAGLEQLVESLAIGSSVHFTGASYGAEKFDFIHASDFFVHTSRWEGLSFSVIEALACGKPCMVTRAANPCGLIGVYGAGMEVEQSPEDIAKAFDKLVQTTASQKESMKREALRLIRTECQWITIAKKITTSYLT